MNTTKSPLPEFLKIFLIREHISVSFHVDHESTSRRRAMEKRGCAEYQCHSLISQNRTLSDLPEPETCGIFVIKEDNIIIYVGQSGDCMRERLLSHLSGYDGQNIGTYMKDFFKDKDYKTEHITLGWVEIKEAKFKEHHYLSCLAERQGEWPKCNLKRGRPTKNPIRTSS